MQRQLPQNCCWEARCKPSKRLTEKTSLMITTDLNVLGDESRSFSDAKMMAALLDRIADYCDILETGNDSYRFKQRKFNIPKLDWKFFTLFDSFIR